MGSQILEKKIYKLNAYMKDIEPYIFLDDKEILENKEKLYSMERVFQLLVDEAIDINANILYSKSKKVPDSYKSSFYDLAEEQIITHDFADRISGSAGLRNNIVHDYEKMQKKDVVNDIKKYFEKYKEYIEILIQKFVSKPE